MASKITEADKLMTAGRRLGIIAIPWAMGMYLPIADHPLQLVVYILFFFAMAFLMAGRWKDAIRMSWALGPVWLLLLWAGLSVLWSVHRPAVMPGWRGLAGTTGYGIMFSFYYNLEEQLRFLAAFILAVAVISLILIVFFPAWGIMSAAHPGSWRGLFEHKNYLGFYAALGIVLFTLGAGGETPYRMISWAGLAVCIALLMGSRCVTGAIATLAALAAYGAVMSFRKPPWGLNRRYVSMAWIAAALIIAGLLAHLPDAPLSLFGREISLSERMDIWAPLLGNGAEHRWLGYGLGSFWNRSSVTREMVMQTLGWVPEHSHNGLIDLYLELGLIGTAIFLVCLTRAFIRALRDALRNPRSIGCWHIAFLVFMTTYNLGESQLFNPGALSWFLFVTATCNLFGRPVTRL